MACIGNMPSFKYVTVEGLVITHREIPYPIKAFTTNKKYIVWNIDRPYQLEDTNVRPESSLLEYLIVINDNGKPTVIEYEELLYSFDQSINGSNLVASSEYNSLKIEVKDTTKKFNLMSNTVDGMSQIIGTTEDLEDGTIIYNLNKVKSDSKSYGISIGEIQTKIDDKYKEIKPIILNDLIEYLRSVSEYKLGFTNVLEDSYLVRDELISIDSTKYILLEKFNKVQSTLMNLKTIVDSIEDIDTSKLISEMKDKLNVLQNSLITMCDSYLQDGKISGEEKTNIIKKVYELTTYIGTVQNTCNNITVNGQAGVVYSIENELLMLKDKTTSTISELTRDTNDLGESVKSQTSEISQMKDDIKLKVEQTDITNTVNDKLNSYSTTEQMNSTINLKVDGITSEVSKTYLSQSDATNTYATKSSLKQTSENIVASFSESGGYNLLKNSAFKNGTTNWSVLRWDGSAGGDSYIEFVSPNYSEWTPANRNSLGACVVNIPDSSVGKYLTVGFDSHKFNVSPNTTYTLNCLMAAHRTKSLTIEIHCFDDYGNRLADDIHGTTIYDIRSGGRDRSNWTKVKHTWNVPWNAVTCHLRVYMNEWSGGYGNAYMWMCEPIVTEGNVDTFWTPNSDEVYTGITTLDEDGITVEMIDGEGSKGYSKVSYQGIATYDGWGNTKSWFSDDNAYIKELNVDTINNPYIIQSKPRPTNWYIGQNATGDGTGRDYYNKSNSIYSTLEYIKNNYGTYSFRQDIIINCDDWMYLNESIYIGGWIGSGKIVLNFGANSTFIGNILVQECVPAVIIDGHKSSWDSNDGCMWYRTDGNFFDAALCVRHSNVMCSGFRSHRGLGLNTYGNRFAHIENGSTVELYNCDLVKYWSICSTVDSSSVYINNIRGDVSMLCESLTNSMLCARTSLPIFEYGNHVEPMYNSIVYNDGIEGNNSIWYPKSLPSEPDIPSIPQPEVPSQSWHWIEKTFYFNLSSTTEGSGVATSNMSDKWGQGRWGNYKPHRGHAVPTENINGWLGSNSRNISMTLTMTRLNTNHGQYGAIPIPKLQQQDGSYWNCGVAFALGDTKDIQLSGGVVSGLANGSLSELTMWAGTSTNDYSRYNNVSLKVVCEKYY